MAETITYKYGEGCVWQVSSIGLSRSIEKRLPASPMSLRVELAERIGINRDEKILQCFDFSGLLVLFAWLDYGMDYVRLEDESILSRQETMKKQFAWMTEERVWQDR